MTVTGESPIVDVSRTARVQALTREVLDAVLARTTRYPANCPSPCPAGGLVIPNLTESSLTVPLTVPGTEFLPD